MQTPSFLRDRQNRRSGDAVVGGAGSKIERDDADLSLAGRKRSIDGSGEGFDGSGQRGERKRFKRPISTLQPPSDEDRDELRRAMFRGTSRVRGRGEGFGFGREGKAGSSSTVAAAAAACFPLTTKSKTKMGPSALPSGSRGVSGLPSRTSHPPPPSISSRNTGTMAQGKTPGFPFMLDDDSSSSSDDEVEEVKVEGDDDSSSLRSSNLALFPAGKPSMGLFEGSSRHVVGQGGSRNENLRRKEDQRVESERLRRDALVRRRRREEMEEGASGVWLGFEGLRAIKEEEEVGIKIEEEKGVGMEGEKDVKREETDRVLVDRNGREAEVITLSDSDDEEDVIAVAQTSSLRSSMSGLPNGDNTIALKNGLKPNQESNEPKSSLRNTEPRHRQETAPQEIPNTSRAQARGSTPPNIITRSAFPSHHSSSHPTFSPPPSKPSSLQDATERIRQERLENAKRIWQGTEARAQAEAEKARRREAEARAEEVHRNSRYSGLTPDVLEGPTRPGLPFENGMAKVESSEMHKGPEEENMRGMIHSGKGEEESPLRVADAEAKKKTNDEPAMQDESQKEAIRRESLIEQPATNKPSVEDLARQRKERQAVLVREAEQKLALEAAKKAESERRMAAYKNSVNSSLADTSVRDKHQSSAQNDRDCRRGVQIPLERNERIRQAVEREKQDASTRRVEDKQSLGIQNPQHEIRHSSSGNLSTRRPSLGDASRNDREEGKKDGPMSLDSFAELGRLKAANVPKEPLQTYGKTAGTSAVTRKEPLYQPKSLKAMAEQGGTITRVQPVSTEPPQPQSLKKSHVPRIELLPEDIKLLFWRDAGNEWQDIIEDYEEATGKRRSGDTLRKRYRQVKEALDGVGASKDLLTRVGTGDLEAKRELDAMLPPAAGDARRPPTVETQPGIVAPSKDQLGELTPQDIRLLVSRGKGMIWSQIVQDFAISTGENVTEALLRARYKLVKEAIGKSEASASLLTQVMAGDDAARERLNRLVHGVWPVPRVETVSQVDRPSKGSSLDRRLGHVSAEDIRLVRWKEEGMSGAEMVEALKQTTGRSRNVSAMLKRCARVRRGLEAAGLHADRVLLDHVTSGDPEAIARLNQMLQSLSTPTGTTENPGRPSSDVAPRLQSMTAHQEPSFNVQQPKQGFDSASTYSSSYGLREDQTVSTPPTSPGSAVLQPGVEH